MTHFAVGKAPHGRGPRTKRQRMRTERAEQAAIEKMKAKAKRGRQEAEERHGEE